MPDWAPMRAENAPGSKRIFISKEIGKLLSEIWRIKGRAEPEYGQQHPITKKLASMHADAQGLLQEKTGKQK